LGHIGSELIYNLPFDAELILVDNFYTQRYCSLFYIPSTVNYKFIEADILTSDLVNIFKGADFVIHLAAITDAESSFDKKSIVDEVNIKGTKRVATACAKLGCHLIYTSTTSVYGVSILEVDESSTQLSPQSPYAESKIESEKIIMDMDGLSFTIFRMGTIFGVSNGIRFHTAINKFCFQASINQPINVWKTAIDQNRPYLDLYDFVRAIKFVIDNHCTNQIFNLVTINTTVRNIIDIIKERVPDLSIKYVDSRIMNQLSYTISNKKFIQLGFNFEGDLHKSINETLDLLNVK